jgi:hypothetical protein
MTFLPLSTPTLIGIWVLLRSDAPLEFQPGTQMHFADGGILTYVIPTADGALSLTLRWRLEEGTLHTDHEDGSNPVAVAVTIGDGGVLVVDFGGPRAFFIRRT